MSQNSDIFKVDVAIAGGGLVGMTLGCALAKGGLKVAVIDFDTPSYQVEGDYDGRASAISYGSAQVFKGIGLWDYIEDHASPIYDVRIADGHPMRGISPLFMHYDHRDLGEEYGEAALGYIIENRQTRVALYKLAKEYETTDAGGELHLCHPVGVATIERTSHKATLTLTDGRQIEAALAVAADGRKSKIRTEAGIKHNEWNYDQTAIVCTVEHERDHQGTAVELFLPNGPFAMLPMTDGRTNIVWSEKTKLAKEFMDLPEEDFMAELQLRFGDWLGDLKLAGPRFAYPLNLVLADHYVEDRLVLAGDAAHGIHPIAGQGYNLGIRDVAALAEILVDAKRLGLDIGSHSILTEYEKWRRFDNVMLAAVCDGLLRLFSNDHASIRLARDLGLAALNKVMPAKKFFMRHAMGVIGDLPRLIRGEKL
ncbi:UbiH/UbiF/VisC/COQ6 family ubiquinone biosynthesis hydroxylase [Curvivirga aplysinae]|uniref:UbiH/UbiF/VisC/COQ6 family ubiquinone biosynthesis hydroxylase n=1 Tax=Curvivirga aplysinae TaxID=2529852 RepID=UPI0012BC0511|nr:UbiH/UbiF/VisC/COQ6 family ubiquinone biosynthesis hydroxylase [Curvivirga aplysinae]MTI08191.1 2-octaprenyl-6-methoxyphenyl hydroxylase [Curvivirga aplysinae]